MPASEAVSIPASRLRWLERGSLSRIACRPSGPIFDAQPDALTLEVNLADSCLLIYYFLSVAMSLFLLRNISRASHI